jgi:hypothetical protein
MPTNNLRRVPMDQVFGLIETKEENWLWDGYLLPGSVTLLTSLWKSGKTTLITGLLQQLARGGTFLGRAVAPGRAWIVSEESEADWAARMRVMPIGPHTQLLARPFRGRPSIDEWNALIDDARDAGQRRELDLFIVDPLASFLPGRCESDAATLLEMLQPLHRLANEGVAVLLLHHPRKKPSEPGHSARGSGALLGFVDIVLEQTRYSKLKSDYYRRLIVALSRKPATPDRLAYEWNPANGQFAAVFDERNAQFNDNWALVTKILQTRKLAITHLELLHDWPSDQERPAASTLYEWLNRGHAEKRVRREGAGTRRNPWRYRLKNKDDEYYDRGELPPLRELGPLFG